MAKPTVPARIAAALREVRREGVPVTVAEVRRRASCNAQSVREFFKDRGIVSASARRTKHFDRWLPCPTAIFFAAHRAKKAAQAPTRDRRPRPAPPSAAGYRPRVYREPVFPI